MTRPYNRGRIFHVPHNVAYRIEDSFVGLNRAAKLGFLWIDLDAQITKDNIVVICHWGILHKDAANLPRAFKKKFGKNVRVSDLTLAQLQTVRSRPLRYLGRRHVIRYRTLGEMARAAAHTKKLGVSMEAKGDPRFANSAFWTHNVLGVIDSAGLPRSRFQVEHLTNMPLAGLVFKAAHNAGARPTIALARGPIPKQWAPYIDYVRGKMRWK